MSTRTRGFWALGAPFVAACVTVNVYFPAAAIQDMSQQIEEAVQERAQELESGEPAEPPPPPETPPQGSDGSSLLGLLLGASPAYAQEMAQPEVTNPAIRKIIDSRAARLPAIGRYLASGVIGESNQALLDIRQLDAVADLRARAEVQKLVREENEDRERLFREIAAAKNVDLSQLPKIRETYAATLHQNAAPGTWIQSAAGEWTRK